MLFILPSLLFVTFHANHLATLEPPRRRIQRENSMRRRRGGRRGVQGQDFDGGWSNLARIERTGDLRRPIGRERDLGPPPGRLGLETEGCGQDRRKVVGSMLGCSELGLRALWIGYCLGQALVDS